LGAVFSAGRVTSAAIGLGIAFGGCAFFFLGSRIANRRAEPALVGPNMSLVGFWASLVIVLVVVVNAIAK